MPESSMTENGVQATSKSFYRRELPSEHVELSSEEGKKRFERAMKQGYAEIFFKLISYYQTQSEPAYCGLTTLTTILNTLAIDPERIWKFPWRWYSEEMLECCVTLEHVKKNGLTMDQLKHISRCEGSITTAYRNESIEKIRELVKQCVKVTDIVIVGCYDRKIVGQTGSGHFSPIAAYDEVSDSVLILDTARFKYSPHWIHLPLLVKATESIDVQTNLSRGFLTFKKNLTQKTKKCHEAKSGCPGKCSENR